MSEAARYAVVLLDRAATDPLPLAKALAAARGTPLQDQMLGARAAWGIVATDASEAEARAVIAALSAAGLKCAACRPDGLVEPPPAEPATTRDALPAEAPILVAAATIPVIVETKTTEKRGPSGAEKAIGTAISLSTGLPIKLGGRARKVETTKEEKTLAFHMDVLYDAPLRRFRIAAAKFDFSCLGARKLYQAQGNLKLLLEELVGAAPDAWRNHGTRILLDAKPISGMGYASLADLDREERWLLTLRKAGR